MYFLLYSIYFQQLEKDIDGSSSSVYPSVSEKRQDIYQQLLTLHSDVTKVSKGVEEVEDRAKKIIVDHGVRFYEYI